MSEPLLTLHRLGVAYRGDGGMVEALGEVELHLLPGERLAVIGESGSGKSTLALAIAGLLPASARVTGHVTWPTLGRPKLGRDIGYVFQDPSSSLDPVLTIGEQIGEVCVTHLGMGWTAARARAAELLGRVALPDPEAALRGFPHQFSGGQRQRIAIAMAIAAGPKLLIADEATSALDTVIQADIVRLIDGLVREEKMTLLYVTHDIALASGFADHIAVVYAGRLVEIGPSRNVLSAPRHPYTKALLSAHLGLDAVQGRHLVVIAGGLPNPADPSPGCRFAPRCPLAEPRCQNEPPWHGTTEEGGLCIHAARESVAA